MSSRKNVKNVTVDEDWDELEQTAATRKMPKFPQPSFGKRAKFFVTALLCVLPVFRLLY